MSQSNMKFVITVPADSLAPIGARPLAETVLNEGLDIFTFKFH